MKNAFDGLISGLVITKEIVCELECNETNTKGKKKKKKDK